MILERLLQLSEAALETNQHIGTRLPTYRNVNESFYILKNNVPNGLIPQELVSTLYFNARKKISVYLLNIHLLFNVQGFTISSSGIAVLGYLNTLTRLDVKEGHWERK
jgi:hypothetical protein